MKSLRHFYNRLFPHSLLSHTFSIHRISQKTSQKKVCIFIFQSFDSCSSFLIFEIFDPLFSRNSWIPNSSSFFLLLDSVTSFIVNFFPHSNIPPPIKCDQWYFLIHSLYATATTPAPWPPFHRLLFSWPFLFVVCTQQSDTILMDDCNSIKTILESRTKCCRKVCCLL